MDIRDAIMAILLNSRKARRRAFVALTYLSRYGADPIHGRYNRLLRTALDDPKATFTPEEVTDLLRLALNWPHEENRDCYVCRKRRWITRQHIARMQE